MTTLELDITLDTGRRKKTIQLGEATGPQAKQLSGQILSQMGVAGILDLDGDKFEYYPPHRIVFIEATINEGRVQLVSSVSTAIRA